MSASANRERVLVTVVAKLGKFKETSRGMLRRRPALDRPPAASSDRRPPASGAGPRAARAAPPAGESFAVAQSVLLRLLGATFFVAFLGAYLQNGALLGSDGLSPARDHFRRLRTHEGLSTPLAGFVSHPAIFWWVPLTDASLDAVAGVGALLSLAVAAGLHSSLALAALWLLYFSIVTAAGGSTFYSYGWESQLLETCFLCVFLCPLRPWRLARGAPSPVVLWLLRWLSFRISTGAGLIKIRGGSCWASKTCLHYHFETQPVPSPLSFFFHFLPKPVLSRAVDLDLAVQLYTAWLVLLPGLNRPLRAARRAGGCIQAAFMLNIISSGNLVKRTAARRRPRSHQTQPARSHQAQPPDAAPTRSRLRRRRRRVATALSFTFPRSSRRASCRT